MPVNRVHRLRSYTTVDNAFLHDRNMDNSCRGLLVTMISLPDGWNFTIRGLASLYNTEGVSSISNTLKKLEKLGYLIRKPMRNNLGRIYDTEYNIYDISQRESLKETSEDIQPVKNQNKKTPHSENPYPVNPYTEKPYPENLTQYNTKESETNESITEGEMTKSVSQSFNDGQTDEELQSLLEELDLWIFPSTIQQIFTDAIERMYYCEKLKVGNSYIPKERVRSKLHLLNNIILQNVQSKLEANKDKIKNPTAYIMTTIYTEITENESALLLELDLKD